MQFSRYPLFSLITCLQMCASFMCTLHKRCVSELDHHDERKGETKQVLFFSSPSSCGQQGRSRDEEVEGKREDEQRDAMRDEEKKYLMVPSSSSIFPRFIPQLVLSYTPYAILYSLYYTLLDS